MVYILQFQIKFRKSMEVQPKADTVDPSHHPTNHYSVISFQKRQRLIQMVLQENYSIYRASRELKIHNSTAKAIIRNYKIKGTIFKRKREEKSLLSHGKSQLQSKANQFQLPSETFQGKEIPMEEIQHPVENIGGVLIPSFHYSPRWPTTQQQFAFQFPMMYYLG